MTYYIILTLLVFYILFIFFLYLLKTKIDKFENEILNNFKSKNNQITSIYEVTNSSLNKHDEIFKEVLHLKKKDFSENSIYTHLIDKSNIYKLIHKELNFIFKVCNKHPKLNKDYKFLYVRDNIINKSLEIGKNLELYKKILKQYNFMIFLKNITIVWLLFPIYKKEVI